MREHIYNICKESKKLIKLKGKIKELKKNILKSISIIKLIIVITHHTKTNISKKKNTKVQIEQFVT